MNFPFQTTLFLVLSSSCFSSVLSRGIKETEILGVEVRGGSSLHYRSKSSRVFSVRSFGARANGVADDSNVCSVFVSFSFL